MGHKVISKFRWVVVLLSLIGMGCETDRLDVDITEVKVEQKWHRLDRDFFELSQESFDAQHDRFQNEMGDFYKVYIEQLLRLGQMDDPALKYSILSFLKNEEVRKLHQEVQSNFEGLEKEQKHLERAFRYYKVHFKERTVPTVVTFTSGFDSKVAATDKFLGIGLDLYLGAQNTYYQQMQWPEYKRQLMNRNRMVYDAMRGWLLTEFDHEENGSSLISRMIVYGKALYAMDAVFYGEPDYKKIGYSAEEQAWCVANEEQVWSNLIESEALFSSNIGAIKRYLTEGPFTPGMPKESPAQVAYWIGWQIVRSYMNEHPELSLEDMMMEPVDGRLFLQQSKYKPK